MLVLPNYVTCLVLVLNKHVHVNLQSIHYKLYYCKDCISERKLDHIFICRYSKVLISKNNYDGNLRGNNMITNYEILFCFIEYNSVTLIKINFQKSLTLLLLLKWSWKCLIWFI